MQNQQNKGSFGKTPGNYTRALVLVLVILMPILVANANFISDLFTSGNAQAENISQTNEQNSQNLDIVEANLSPLLTNDEGSIIKTEGGIALVAVGNPTETYEASGAHDENAEDVSFYIVNTGDTLAEISKMYDVSPDTIVWANHLTKGQPLKEGTMLIIYPVDAISHKIAKGDTLAGIAKKYNIETDKIDEFNSLDGKLVVGDEILIPGAKPVNPKTVAKNTKVKLPQTNGETKVVGNGYFTRPVIGCPITQGRHDSHGVGGAVDFGCPTGTPIYAAAAGTVQFAAKGYNGGFGNLIILKHPNGTLTYYAHQSRLGAKVGDVVKKGQVIGYVGSTGRSTGPHLHFETRNTKNPWFGQPKGSRK